MMFRTCAASAILALTLLVAAPVAAQAPVGPPSVEEFYGGERLKTARLSPSGRYLALIRNNGPRDILMVVDLQERKSSVVLDLKDWDVVHMRLQAWKGEDRLVLRYSTANVAKRDDGSLRTTTGPGPARAKATGFDARWTSIKRDGTGQVQFEPYALVDTLPDNPDEILIAHGELLGLGYFGSYGEQNLFRLNVVTGAETSVIRGSQRTIGWLIDRTGQPVLRYDIYGRRGGLRVYGRADENRWQELFSIREKDFRSMPDLEILGPSNETGKMYVAVRPEDRSSGDTREVRLYDFVNRTMGPKVWAHPKYDVDDVAFYEDDWKLAGACYWADVYVCDYFDANNRREFEAIHAFFEGERSIQVTSSSRDGSIKLLSVSGPDEPGSLYVYDRKTRRVDLLGSRWPTLKPDRLGLMSRFTFTTRDSVDLGGYLTVPPPGTTTGKLPLIVMPHGGPEARDHFDYDRWAQIFATHGYIVLQPTFRGSGGFGAGFAEAGYGQWGARMQDDVMDAMNALIAKGQVDPDRICIVGASYGGYVALQAGATAPDTFKCVVSIAGVSDLVASQAWEKAEGGADSPRYKYWLKSIGDPVTDRARLVDASPISHAQNFRAPVLLYHGDWDGIVDVEQSEAMAKALKRAKKDVRLEILEGQGHPGWEPLVEAPAMTDILAFVDAAIGSKGEPK
ncbi:MAG TPA: alpha/beta fold hydrolase [Caulobacter sp.]|nr:alpha/beta fold hydrolase [Caulobacter sp.]